MCLAKKAVKLGSTTDKVGLAQSGSGSVASWPRQATGAIPRPYTTAWLMDGIIHKERDCMFPLKRV